MRAVNVFASVRPARRAATYLTATAALALATSLALAQTPAPQPPQPQPPMPAPKAAPRPAQGFWKASPGTTLTKRPDSFRKSSGGWR